MARFLKAKTLLLSLGLLLTLLLSACGGAAGTGSTTSGNTTKGPIVVASKLDTEGQLLAQMYDLLLEKAGYKVTLKLALGNSLIISQAIKSGSVDLYPEFTATGLNQLNIAPAHDPQKDYDAVKAAYEQQFHITWLDYAPLNDGYALCTSKSEAAKLGNITTISQLAPQVKNLALASPSDGISFIDGLKPVYGFDTKSFKSLDKVDYAIGFKAVTSGQAQAVVCYTTDGSVTQQDFIFLTDDKSGFPEFHPAPIVRDSVLSKYPDIATILNPLAPDLTTQVSIDLQNQVATMTKGGASSSAAIKNVAKQFLQSKGLL
ncbi:MAG TPA: glycine betaine ABC transporter substrate-binding protein [Ktedonobacteraceae bacterium]|nr:glycine betaine ABC transporter substrate-binding protein [Ktedonobacteraceae bacterium]